MSSQSRRERKVVTVLFADLVGFTARAEQLDPEDVEAILRPYHERLRTELERYGGTVEKFIGDAVMALFGAPVAHEDDPERAVRAALAIRDWAREDETVQVRIAVNTGEALVSLGARPESGEGMAAGDVVNTAARLQSAAPVNGVLVGETTYRATRHGIDYRDAEPVEAKGKTEPVPTWEALAPRARFGADVAQHGRAPLVGRTRELDVLIAAFDRARQERAPQLVTLVGVPGIGKSRLVFELFRHVEADPELVYWRQGRSLPYGEAMSFWPLAEMVKAHAGVLEGDSSEVATEKLAAALAEVIPEDEVGWVEGNVRPLLGLAGAESELGGESEAFTAWRRFFEGLADQRPVVLVFEDLHWADEAMLDFVDHLVDWAGDVPLLVLGTARPELLEQRPGWGGGKRNASTLMLSALTDEEAARLVGVLLDQAVLPADTQRALLDRAGGNPLYAEQYVRLFVERGSPEDLPLPENVQGIIAARLDGLPVTEKRLLQDAAVVGKVFWSGAVASIGDADDAAALAQPLHALVRKEFLRRERRSSVSGEEEYAFRHGLVRDVAYGQIPRVDRAERHMLAARWIESLGRTEDHAELLAHHYLTALELTRAAGRDAAELKPPALRALREAGERALALNAYAAAVGFYRSALELSSPNDPERPQLLFGYGKAVFNAEERGADVLAEASSALEAAGDIDAAAEAEVILAELGWKDNSQKLMLEHLDRAAALTAGLPPCRAKAFVLSTVSRYRMLAGENEEAIRVGREAQAMAEQLGLAEIRAHALTNIGPARVFSGDPGGFADLEEAIASGAAINSPETMRAYTNLGAVAAFQGDLRRCFELEEEGLALARRFGHEPTYRFLLANAGVSAYDLGDWERALRTAEDFAVEGDSGRHHYQESPLRMNRGMIYVARGDMALGLAEAETALALARDARDPQALGAALSKAAYISWLAGRPEQADSLLGERFDDPGFGLFGLYPEAAWLLVELGRGASLGEDAVRHRQNPWVVAFEAVRAGELTAAADIHESAGALPGEAFCRLRAAERLVEQGRRAEADQQLRQALAIYRSVGATRYIREGEALLAATA